MPDEMRYIPLDELVDPFVILRPVRKGTTEFKELSDSVAQHGVTKPILVRPSKKKPGKFEIVDGMWRKTAAIENRQETIPCVIKDLTDNEVLVLQLQLNAIGAKTTDREYAKRLKLIYQSKPGMTYPELSAISGKSPKWIRERLKLLSLSEEVQDAIERGDIPVASAYLLAKINPLDVREQYVALAMTLQAEDFAIVAAEAIKKYTEGIRQGKLEEKFVNFKPHPYCRTYKELVKEMDESTIGGIVIVTENCRSLMDVWKACLKWVMHMDKMGIEDQKSHSLKLSRNIIKRGNHVEE